MYFLLKPMEEPRNYNSWPLIIVIPDGHVSFVGLGWQWHDELFRIFQRPNLKQNIQNIAMIRLLRIDVSYNKYCRKQWLNFATSYELLVLMQTWGGYMAEIWRKCEPFDLNFANGCGLVVNRTVSRHWSIVEEFDFGLMSISSCRLNNSTQPGLVMRTRSWKMDMSSRPPKSPDFGIYKKRTYTYQYKYISIYLLQYNHLKQNLYTSSRCEIRSFG